MEFFARRVTGQADDLHAVAQRGGDALDVVRRGDENDLAQVEGHVEIAVHELVVLARVEHFEQRAGGVAAHVAAELVHLVEHEHRVARAEAAQFLDDASRHRADVGAAVAADLGLVADAAERDARELAAQRVGDGLTQARLADPGRSQETEDRAAPGRVELADREVFDEPALDLGQPVMVAVEHFLRVVEVGVVLAELGPGQVGEHLHVGNDHAVFRAGAGNVDEPLEFLLGRLP